MKQQHASLLDLRDFDRAKFDVDEASVSADQALLREQAAISRSNGQVWTSSCSGINFLLCLERTNMESQTFGPKLALPLVLGDDFMIYDQIKKSLLKLKNHALSLLGKW